MRQSKREICNYDKAAQEKFTEKLVGIKINKLTIVSVIGRTVKTCEVMVEALCDCGNSIAAAFHDIKKGHTRSCGCFRKESAINVAMKRDMSKVRFSHGEARTGKVSKEYKTWIHLKRKYKNSERAGICERWLEPEKGCLNFIEDVGRSPGNNYFFKRIDESLEFCKENCKWEVRKTSKKTRNLIKGFLKEQG